MRQIDSIIRQLSKAKRDLEELKTAQFTGTEQIRAKNIIAPNRTFTPTVMFQSVDTTIKAFKITVRAVDFDSRNVLLVYPIVEAWQNGAQVLNFRNGSISYDRRTFLGQTDNSKTERSWVFVVISPKNQTYELRTQFFTSANIEYEIQELS